MAGIEAANTAGNTASEPATSPGTAACASPESTTGAGDQGLPSANSSAQPPSVRDEQLYNLRFACFDNAAYHAARAGYYEKLHRLIMATVIITSSATIASFGGVEPFQSYELWWGVVPLLASTSDLVWGPGSKAQTHAALRARYFELLADIEDGDPTPENCRRWSAALHRTYAAEPPITYRAVKAMAYNAATDALWPEEVAKDRRLYIPFYDRLRGRFFPLHAASYKPGKTIWQRVLQYVRRAKK